MVWQVCVYLLTGFHPGESRSSTKNAGSWILWFLYPDFSIRWSGQCGISEYDEFIGGEEMDENGLVPISYTLARSLEANIFLLAQTDGGYYLQSAEAFYASHTYA